MSLPDLLGAPLARALTTALLHFLWEGAVVALATAAAWHWLVPSSATARYRLGMMALAVMVLLPALTTGILMAESGALPEGSGRNLAPAFGGTDGEAAARALRATADPIPSVIPSPDGDDGKAPWRVWILNLWIAGVLAISLLHLGGWRRLDQLGRSDTADAPPAIQTRANALGRRLGLGSLPPVRLSLRARVPMVVGWLRPVVLVPTSVALALPPQQLEAILAHELAHLRCLDHWLNLLQTCVETLLFFHPAVWWLSARVRAEREHRCDDLAVALCADRHLYARALLRLEELRQREPALALAATGGQLLPRIRRILGGHVVNDAPRPYRRLAGLLVVLTMAGTGSVLALAAATHSDGIAALDMGLEPLNTGTSASTRNAGPGLALDLAVAVDTDIMTDIARDIDVAVATQDPPTDAESRPDAAPSASDRGDRQDDVDGVEGVWWLKHSHGELRLRVESERRRSHQMSATLTIDPEVLRSLVRDHPETFTLRRDAGTFHFEGRLRGEGEDLRGSGDFVFAPDEDFEDRLQNLGVRGSLDDWEQFLLAVSDVGTDFVTELRDLGFEDFHANRLVELGIHDVTPAYIREMREHGVDEARLERYVEMRIHDVDPEYIRGMAEAGYKDLSASRLVEMRIHDVDPELVRSLAEAGLDDLSTEQIVELSIHDVTPRYVQEMAETGYPNLSARRLVEFRIHDVDPEFIRGMAEAGYSDLSAGRLVELRIHDVDPEFVSEMSEVGLADLSVRRLVELRIHDVTPDFVQGIAAAGYPDLPASKLVELRIHDVTPRYIERLQAKGLEDIDIDDVVQMRMHGMDF